MAVRPIDGNELYRIEKLLDTNIVRQDKVALNLLEQVLYDIQHVPTLTPPNEPLTLETVAEILAEHFGDECACNFNGNDEWLPEVCQYENTCPNPPERLGCWMEFLRHKYRRSPEGVRVYHG